MLQTLRSEIKKAGDPERASHSLRFFKTGAGQYGEGDVFYGITVPMSRRIAAQYTVLSLPDLSTLLHSPVHEERLIALIILITKYKKGDATVKKEIYTFYLGHMQYINNWDLVDSSADKIVGEYLWGQKDSFATLSKLARSEDLWEKRIAILATFAFINHGESKMTFQIADILLHDTHDLIHKAVGWLLREVGKRVSQEDEEEFLRTRYKTMPRTMLRYAIERFPEEKRKKYLQGLI